MVSLIMTGRVTLEEAILNAAAEKVSPAGFKYISLELKESAELARRYGKPLICIETTALKNNVIPERYQRNMGTIGPEGQLKLLSSVVAVIGLGGLGGLAAELLARMGVGGLVLVDGDVFSDSNLNRQVLSATDNLGKSKAGEAARRVQMINRATEVTAHNCFAEKDKLLELVENVQVAVDCLDNLKTRFELEKACGERKIPLVHGAIAGSMGQVAVIRPGEPLLASIYGNNHAGSKKQETRSKKQETRSKEQEAGSWKHDDRGIEIILGNPATTPAVIAAWQVSETVKLLLGHENFLKNELLYIDMDSNETTRITLNPR